MRRKIRSEPIEEPTVNITPLIDVVFVILIMFIVVAPLLEMDKVQLADAPQSSNDVSAVQEMSPIAIHVHKDNTIWLNGERVNSEQLLIQLQQLKQRFEKTNPLLFHDKEAHFGTYQGVKNTVEAAGFQELDIVLKPS